VRFLRGKLLPRAGITDFGFIESLVLDLESAAPETRLPRIMVGEYLREEGIPVPTVLNTEGTDDSNLSPYVDERFLRVIATITGSVPADDWIADIELCFYLKGTYERDGGDAGN
jgi:hypothetical protein